MKMNDGCLIVMLNEMKSQKNLYKQKKKVVEKKMRPKDKNGGKLKELWQLRKRQTEMILTFVEKKVAEKKNRAKEKLDEWLKELLQLRKRQAK